MAEAVARAEQATMMRPQRFLDGGQRAARYHLDDAWLIFDQRLADDALTLGSKVAYNIVVIPVAGQITLEADYLYLQGCVDHVKRAEELTI